MRGDELPSSALVTELPAGDADADVMNTMQETIPRVLMESITHLRHGMQTIPFIFIVRRRVRRSRLYTACGTKSDRVSKKLLCR